MPHTKHLETLFSAIDEGYCLCEMIHDAEGNAVDYRFLEVNALFAEMTGLKDARGRTARELVPGLEQVWVDTYAKVAAGEAMRFQNESEAMGRWFDVFATPVQPQGRFALVFRDITAQRQAELGRERALQRAEALVHEINHRVMNSLAMIGSIMRMEAQGLTDPAATATMGRLEARLQAVTSLYRALNAAALTGEASGQAVVPAQVYLRDVAEAAAAAMGDPERIALDCDIAALDLAPDRAAQLGMMVSELITNALKYAFPDGRSGTVTVRLRPVGEGALALSVGDDGVGSAADIAAHRHRVSGMGSRLIEAFAEQLGGTLTQRSDAAGTEVSLRFAA